MDWFPLYNSLRIALIASVIVFFSGIFSAYYIAKLPPAVKGVLDVVLTLPLVLPPTVVGYFLLMLMGPRRPFGTWVLETYKNGHDLVFRDFCSGSSGISAYVPDSPRCF